MAYFREKLKLFLGTNLHKFHVEVSVGEILFHNFSLIPTNHFSVCSAEFATRLFAFISICKQKIFFQSCYSNTHIHVYIIYIAHAHTYQHSQLVHLPNPFALPRLP